MEALKGILPALITPLDEGGRVSRAGLETLLPRAAWLRHAQTGGAQPLPVIASRM